MAEILLFHHAQGMTAGLKEFAGTLRAAGHTVHAPDLFDGRIFDSLDDGLDYAGTLGFDTVLRRGAEAAADLPAGLVYLGFSLGVMPAQRLAQTRGGARGAILLHSCLPVGEFGGWPAGVPVQVHAMEQDPFFAGGGDLDAARALTSAAADAGLFLYPGAEHLFADSSLPSYDTAAAALLTRRVLGFLAVA
ncbi:dienelactone hydrolase [Arthrobacter crusticola]|uniref:Dienelactone hydrolase n=1 Tax=Arthrobacter crusticola TaxID=2547960 RepID=A0A4R5U383_9MICC|nr:dienelactone hydrolase family protein [Arthrobacter crusticola]TDK28012.1 dienelactone hydrolase [Arthrobacter crusticola]